MHHDLPVNVALEEFPDFHYLVVEVARIGRNEPTFRPHLADRGLRFIMVRPCSTNIHPVEPLAPHPSTLADPSQV